jgi:hypothetical protein
MGTSSFRIHSFICAGRGKIGLGGVCIKGLFSLKARLSKPRVKKRAAYVSRTEICSQRFAMKAFTDRAALRTRRSAKTAL